MNEPSSAHDTGRLSTVLRAAAGASIRRLAPLRCERDAVHHRSMLTYLRSSVVILLLVFVGNGCGDDGAEAEDPFGPGCDEGECRGDITGSWEILGGCAVDAEEENKDCAGMRCTIVDVQASGEYDFGADAAASYAWKATVTTACSVPKACIEVACAELQTNGRTCADNGDACQCSQVDEAAGDLAGQWSTDGGLLEVSSGDTMSATSNWCVRDDHLAINVLASRSLQFDAVGFVGSAVVRLTAARR
jgi:hypothetical protein